MGDARAAGVEAMIAAAPKSVRTFFLFKFERNYQGDLRDSRNVTIYLFIHRSFRFPFTTEVNVILITILYRFRGTIDLEPMSATQYFPVPPELFALAIETVSRRVSRLPFLRSGVMVTGELLGVAMECLNAEFNKTLALRTPPYAAQKPEDGLDHCIEERLRLLGKTVTPVIVDVMCSANIAETTEIMDRVAHRPRKAVRLLPPWTWHAASGMSPAVRFPGSGDEDESPLSWMSMCPVCRTGILNRVVGKQTLRPSPYGFLYRVHSLRFKVYSCRLTVPAGIHRQRPRPALEKIPGSDLFSGDLVCPRAGDCSGRKTDPTPRGKIACQPVAKTTGRGAQAAEGRLPGDAVRGKDPLFQTGETGFFRAGP